MKTVFVLGFIFIFISCKNEDSISYPICGEYSSSLFLGVVEDGNLEEISGVALSLKNEGIIWVHNDSGHTASVYALNSDREIVVELILDGVDQVDWEDISVGPCETGECIFIGDIGDNDADRDSIGIYVLEEPDVDPDDAFSKVLYKDFELYRFEYKDKPRNAEALAVHPDGNIYVFSKEDDLSAVFKIPELKKASLTTLEYVGRIETSEKVTAVDIHRSGEKLLLMTTVGLYEISMNIDETFESQLSGSMVPVQSDIDHGEAAGYDPHTGYIYYSSEADSDDPPLNVLKCR